MDIEKVKEISRLSKLEKWPYPKTFNSLKDGGVESYETQVSTHEIIYSGNKKSWIEVAPEDFKTIKVQGPFNAKQVANVITHHNVEKTTYEQFLNGIAHAGCWSYVVNIATREIHYLGKNKNEVHTEKVPQF